MKKIFIYLSIILATRTQAQNIDINLLNAINSSKTHPSSTTVFKDISYSSYALSIAAPVTVFSIGLIKKDKTIRSRSYQMAAGIGLAMSMSVLLKHSVNRTRPYETYNFIVPKVKEHSASFPSGHTTAAFETATSLSLNFPKWYVILPAYTWASAVGYSRMYLGVHYPSDVAAGMLIGAGSAWLTYELNKKLRKKKTVD
jgi:membrane-associated phospholipid phosphatase